MSADQLSAQHAAYLAERAVSPDVAAERGYRTASRKGELAKLGFGASQQLVPSLVVPVWAPWTTAEPVLHQIRPDNPRRSPEGKIRKFEMPAKAGLRLDVHPRTLPVVGDPRTPLLVTEGIVKADSAVSHMGVCTVGLAGVWSWRGSNDQAGKTALGDWEHVALADRLVVIAFDSDVMTKPSVADALDRLGAFLHRRGAHVRYGYLDAGDAGAKIGLDDWIGLRLPAAPGALWTALLGLCDDRPRRAHPDAVPVAPYVPPAARTLADVDKTFGGWLDALDVDALHVVIAALVANRSDGDPVFLLVIAPPSSGKTEIVSALSTLPDVVMCGRLTVPALLSGTPSRERSSDATGGVLRLIGDRGVLVVKDFGALLAMQRDDRGETLQALRDIFDQHYYRDVGVDGGRRLTWAGHCGLVAASTEAIDSHYSVIAALGDRYVSIRLRLGDAEDQADRAIRGNGDEETMRAELNEAVAGFVGHLTGTPAPLTEDDRKRTARLAALAVRCRSFVERDPRTREIVSVPEAEQPARVAKQLAALLAALRQIGCPDGEAWSSVSRVALDSMPTGRRRVLGQLVRHTAPVDTRSVGEAVGLPTTSVHRHLEDLNAHGVVTRDRGGRGNADHWLMAEWTRDRWPSQPVVSPSPDTTCVCDGYSVDASQSDASFAERHNGLEETSSHATSWHEEF